MCGYFGIRFINSDTGRKVYNRLMKPWLEKMLQKCIQRIMKENLLLLKDSLDH